MDHVPSGAGGVPGHALRRSDAGDGDPALDVASLHLDHLARARHACVHKVVPPGHFVGDVGLRRDRPVAGRDDVKDDIIAISLERKNAVVNFKVDPKVEISGRILHPVEIRYINGVTEYHESVYY